MKVEYEIPAPVRSFRDRAACWIALGLSVAVLALVTAILWNHGAHAYAMKFLSFAGSAFVLFGVNTVSYETPVTGTTPPTATQARTHQQVSAIITGDGAATTFTVTHNWGLSTADNNAGWAEVEYEYLLAAGYTAAALITSKGANSVVFSCTAFTGAGLRVRLKRPWTPTR